MHNDTFSELYNIKILYNLYIVQTVSCPNLPLTKKLLPFSRFLLKCPCTGRFGTGVVDSTTPVLVPFS